MEQCVERLQSRGSNLCKRQYIFSLGKQLPVWTNTMLIEFQLYTWVMERIQQGTIWPERKRSANEKERKRER